MRVQDRHALRAQTTFRRAIYYWILVLLRTLPLHLLLSKADSSKRRIERHRTSTSGHNYRIDIDRKLCSCFGVQSSYLPLACFHTLDQRDVMFEQNGSTACFTNVHEHFFSKRILVGFAPANQSTATQSHLRSCRICHKIWRQFIPNTAGLYCCIQWNNNVTGLRECSASSGTAGASSTHHTHSHSPTAITPMRPEGKKLRAKPQHINQITTDLNCSKSSALLF